MSLGGSYKKPLFILVLVFFVYKLFDYYSNLYEGLEGPECVSIKGLGQCNDTRRTSYKGPKCTWIMNPNNKRGEYMGKCKPA